MRGKRKRCHVNCWHQHDIPCCLTLGLLQPSKCEWYQCFVVKRCSDGPCWPRNYEYRIRKCRFPFHHVLCSTLLWLLPQLHYLLQREPKCNRQRCGPTSQSHRDWTQGRRRLQTALRFITDILMFLIKNYFGNINLNSKMGYDSLVSCLPF